MKYVEMFTIAHNPIVNNNNSNSISIKVLKINILNVKK